MTASASHTKAPADAPRRGRFRRFAGRVASCFAGLTAGDLGWIAASAFLMVFMLPTKTAVVLGLPPQVPAVLAWFAVVPLLLTIRGREPRVAGGIAFLTFLFAKGGTVYWLVYTIHHYGFIHIVPAVGIYLALITILAAFWGLTFNLVRRLTAEPGEGGPGLPMALVLPVAWVAQEWFQSWILTGFPWSFLGYATAGTLTLAQSGDLFGVWGLSLLAALVNAAVYEAVRFRRGARKAFPVVPVIVAAALFVANAVYGVVRTGQIERVMETRPALKVAVLQGNIDQNEKWRDPTIRERTPGMYLDMAVTANRDRDLSLVILPETSLTLWQQRDAPLRRDLRRFGLVTGTYVLTGIPTKGYDQDGDKMNYNSAVLISPDGKDLGWYHKNRLVPFGEYIPLKKELKPILGDLVAGSGNFRPWGQYSLFEIPEGAFGVMICYETIFPGLVRTIVNQGATFLPNITNDAWFGDTSAPHQHLQMVQMRAIENRLYVPRAANTGISGIVDAAGRIVYQSPVYKQLYYVGEIRTMETATLYRRIGDALAIACFAVFCGLALALPRLRRRANARSAK